MDIRKRIKVGTIFTKGENAIDKFVVTGIDYQSGGNSMGIHFVKCNETKLYVRQYGLYGEEIETITIVENLE